MNNPVLEWLRLYFDEVAPKDFYRGIFPAGELERKGEYITGKYTGIIVSVSDSRKKDGKRKIYRYTMTDDLDAVDIACASDDFCICSPLSYAGKARTAENARMMYAIAVDVDKILMERGKPLGLENLWFRHIEDLKRLPKPTYIVSSGSGIHLYYVLECPIHLFEENSFELQELKRELTRFIWHDAIVDIKSNAEVQQEGIYQGFRMPGTITKYGTRACAFRTGEKVSIDYLLSFVGVDYKKNLFRSIKTKKVGHISLAEAAEKYPDWYERRIVNGESRRGGWAVSRRLYDWWKDRIWNEAKVGHRYYCMMALAIYAQKCSFYNEKHNPNPVTRDELERDCAELLDHFENMTNSEDNHFTSDDVLAALEAFDERMVKYPRSAIEYHTAIPMPANKRNGQKLADHLEEARAIRDIRARRRGEPWYAHNGRKSKEPIVVEWRKSHPYGRKIDCIRDTGLSNRTVYKHWDSAGAKKD